MRLLCGRFALRFLGYGTRGKGYYTMPLYTLLLLRVGTDRTQVIVKATGIGLANLVQFFNDGIALHDLYLNQFLGRANNGRLVPKGPDQCLYFGPKCGIGNMRTVPGQQIVHAA